MNPQHSVLDPVSLSVYIYTDGLRIQIIKCDLLECLREEEALLHVVMADCCGVNVTDPREAGLHSAVLLQGLTGDTRRI